MSAPGVVAIVGPTASGKSDLAIEVCERIGGEVVNADSMQVYRGMDIGTAKVAPAERRGIAHHVIDILDVGQPSTVAEFQGWAREAIGDCRARGVVPVVVGGSALYVRAILDEFEFPGTDPAVRARYAQLLNELGSAALHARLSDVDPAAAAAILPSNGRRIVRALEVIEITGRPFRATLPEPTYAFDDVTTLGLAIDRTTLDERIERRVDRMWADGLVDEVRHLQRQGLSEGPTASRALGYRQVLDFLAGEIDEATARERTVVGTRKFARRQASWFDRDARITWLPHDTGAEAALAAVSSTV